MTFTRRRKTASRSPLRLIDKPIADSLTDAVAIFEAARHFNVPVFSSSSLRYGVGTQAVRNGKIGEVLGCDTDSPCELEMVRNPRRREPVHGDANGLRIGDSRQHEGLHGEGNAD